MSEREIVFSAESHYVGQMKDETVYRVWWQRHDYYRSEMFPGCESKRLDELGPYDRRDEAEMVVRMLDGDVHKHQQMVVDRFLDDANRENLAENPSVVLIY